MSQNLLMITNPDNFKRGADESMGDGAILDPPIWRHHTSEFLLSASAFGFC